MTVLAMKSGARPNEMLGQPRSAFVACKKYVLFLSARWIYCIPLVGLARDNGIRVPGARRAA